MPWKGSKSSLTLCAASLSIGLFTCCGGGPGEEGSSPALEQSAGEAEAPIETRPGEPSHNASSESSPSPPENESPEVEAESSQPAVMNEAAEAESSKPSPPPDEPKIVEVTVPAGTIFELELMSALDTSVSRVGDEIQARTISPVYHEGEAVLPKGTYVEGRVIEVQASGRVKGRAQIAFTFDRIKTRTGIQTIQTSYVDQEAESGRKKDAAVIGGGAGVGALVGGIIGGKKGAAIGAAVGGAGGTGVVLATKGKEIKLPVGTEVNVRLDSPIVVQLN